MQRGPPKYIGLQMVYHNKLYMFLYLTGLYIHIYTYIRQIYTYTHLALYKIHALANFVLYVIT